MATETNERTKQKKRVTINIEPLVKLAETRGSSSLFVMRHIFDLRESSCTRMCARRNTRTSGFTVGSSKIENCYFLFYFFGSDGKKSRKILFCDDRGETNDSFCCNGAVCWRLPRRTKTENCGKIKNFEEKRQKVKLCWLGLSDNSPEKFTWLRKNDVKVTKYRLKKCKRLVAMPMTCFVTATKRDTFNNLLNLFCFFVIHD